MNTLFNILCFIAIFAQIMAATSGCKARQESAKTEIHAKP